MMHIVLIAIGGAGGAVSRYLLSNWMHQRWSAVFPLGTLTVNLLGSFVIGIMYVLITERLLLHSDLKHVFIVGFLGAFTTFSTFSLEVVTLLENGQLGTALLYVVASLLLCTCAAWLAISLTRMI